MPVAAVADTVAVSRILGNLDEPPVELLKVCFAVKVWAVLIKAIIKVIAILA